MPFPFVLPTTSKLSFETFASSTTHPSLPLAASNSRAGLRHVLKSHKRLAIQSQSANLGVVLAAIEDYVPFITALKVGFSGGRVGDEEIHLALKAEILGQWRTSLTSSPPGKMSVRAKGRGLDFELCFVLTVLAFVYNAQARAQLLALYGAITPPTEQRAAIITGATKLLLDAHSIHLYLSSYCVETDASSGVVETLTQTQAGLAALSLAEATLLAVLKDDPYPAVVTQDRNKNDKEWMIKPPEIPKVRAHLFARLCLAAAEHAGKAEAMFSTSGRLDEDLLQYVGSLRKTSRARACRFFGIDAELGGETGKGIAWLVAGKKQLGYAGKGDESSRLKGIAKVKKDWTERREDRRMEKGGDWGNDAGRLEELRVIEMLEQKWNKMNDTINTQTIPPSDPLIATLPSGRDVHTQKPYILPQLDEESLVRMRAPPESARISSAGVDNDSSDEEGNEGGETNAQSNMPGSFVGSSHDSSYY